ncbi:hypothetical protein C7410_11755 [Paraburkholderia silvatlantica]|uniref:Uncharacterized protein n=1 Tax=Paraburkholderia silvatlantica TaxID=321895 RepID=A0A2V4TY76_9BURK|nr:hypothetical protein C7410_11755 [Paraburkholderia silvatlantica]
MSTVSIGSRDSPSLTTLTGERRAAMRPDKVHPDEAGLSVAIEHFDRFGSRRCRFQRDLVVCERIEACLREGHEIPVWERHCPLLYSNVEDGPFWSTASHRAIHA